MNKWMRKEAYAWISDMFNHYCNMRYDWTMNWIKPLHKCGTVNNINHY